MVSHIWPTWPGIQLTIEKQSWASYFLKITSINMVLWMGRIKHWKLSFDIHPRGFCIAGIHRKPSIFRHHQSPNNRKPHLFPVPPPLSLVEGGENQPTSPCRSVQGVLMVSLTVNTESKFFNAYLTATRTCGFSVVFTSSSSSSPFFIIHWERVSSLLF